MPEFFKRFRLLLPALLLAACSPARTGLIGNTLTTNVRPLISITAQPPLTPLAHGRLHASGYGPAKNDPVALSFDFALFADPEVEARTGSAEPGAAVERFSLAAILRITEQSLQFQPKGQKAYNAFSISKVRLNGIDWTEELLRISSGGDWAAAVWRENGRAVPEFWLTKRWTAHLADRTIAVMEYREAWPACLAPISRDVLIQNDPGGTCLQDFLNRADAAFRADRSGGDFKGEVKTPPSSLRLPREMPDITAMAGELVYSNMTSR